MPEGGPSLTGLSMMAAGAVLMYSGVNDPVGGPLGLVQAVLQGQQPTLKPKLVTGSSGGGSTTGVVNPGTSAPGDSSTRQKIIDVARKYLGVPWKFAGSSMSGIDCSGLTMVAYRDGAGIKLPHLAAAQGSRGKRIPIDQAQLADLVLWGVPGAYHHVALFIDKNTFLSSPSLGGVVHYAKMYGKPDFVRVLNDTPATSGNTPVSV